MGSTWNLLSLNIFFFFLYFKEQLSLVIGIELAYARLALNLKKPNRKIVGNVSLYCERRTVCSLTPNKGSCFRIDKTFN